MENHEKQNKREEILNAATDEFLDKGYDGAKTVSIASRAGVTHAMLHYYFHTKRDLFEQILIRKFELIFNSVLIAFSQTEGEFIDRLCMAAKNHFEFLLQNPGIPKFIITEIIGNKDNMDLVINVVVNKKTELFAIVQDELNKGIEKGIFKNVSAINLIIDFIGLNIFPFLFSDLATKLIGGNNSIAKETFYSMRLKENIETLRSRLLVNY